MQRIQKVLAPLVGVTLLVLMPFAASADTVSASAQAHSGIAISPSGVVRVIGAEVTAVGNNVVDAVVHFGNVMLNLVVNTSDATKVGANGSMTASTTAIAVGDTVNIKGSLASSTSAGLTIAANKIRDLTSFPRKIASSTKDRDGDGDHNGDNDAHVQVQAGTNATVNVDEGKPHGFLGRLGLHLGFDD
ncbi:MAG TPA: hypothetical protein VN495_01485 [Candidatus Paceibacterota bacterium]|nr:hypothetical protein [Candidatus Paceibacterota bacterium]